MLHLSIYRAVLFLGGMQRIIKPLTCYTLPLEEKVEVQVILKKAYRRNLWAFSMGERLFSMRLLSNIFNKL